MPKTVKNEKNLFSEEKLYKISNVLSGKFLTADEEGELFIASARKDDSQKWKFVPEKDAYILVSALSGKVADVVLAGTVNGARLHMWEKTGEDNQLWTAEKVSTGVYKLKSLKSGKCVDVVDISDEDGTPLQIWDDLNGDNQMWKIAAIPVSKKAAVKTQAKKSEPVKAEATKAEAKKSETVKAETPKAAAKIEEAVKAAAPKAMVKKEEPAKTAAPKAEVKKAEAPKAPAAKAAPKAPAKGKKK